MVIQLVSKQEIVKGLSYLLDSGQFHECLRHGDFVLASIRESDDIEDEITVLADLIEACLQISDFDNLKTYFLQYEEKIQQTKQQQAKLRYLIIKGHVQIIMLNDEDTAMHFYKKAASFAYTIQDYGRLTVILSNIIYLQKNKLPSNQLLKLAELNYIFAHQATERKGNRIIICALKLLDCYVELKDCKKFYHLYQLVKNMPELQNHYREKIMIEIVYASGLICDNKYEEALHVLYSLEEELENSSDLILLLEVLHKFQMIYTVYRTEKLEDINKKIAYYNELQKKRAEEFGPIFQNQTIQKWKLQQQTIHQYTGGLIDSAIPFSYTLFQVAKDDYNRLICLIREECKNTEYKIMKVYEDRLILIINHSESPLDLIENFSKKIPSLEHAILLSTQTTSPREFFDLTHAILYYKQFKKCNCDRE